MDLQIQANPLLQDAFLGMFQTNLVPTTASSLPLGTKVLRKQAQLYARLSLTIVDSSHSVRELTMMSSLTVNPE